MDFSSEHYHPTKKYFKSNVWLYKHFAHCAFWDLQGRVPKNEQEPSYS